MIASASFRSRRPVSRCVCAAAFLMLMTASTKAARGRRPETGKFMRARWVCTPYSACAGTASSPRGSFSRRVSVIASFRFARGASVATHESPIVAFLPSVADRARFAAEKMQKQDCFASDRLLLGLNCFEPGQDQKVHAHEGADKFYLVLRGRATIVVGE